MQIIAHRGASHAAPENTLAAVKLAWEEGADAIEVDVHLTRDRRLAVIHDADTLRTAGTACVVAETKLAELQQLDVGRWKEERFAGECVPSLEEVLALVPPNRRIFVEVKAGLDVIGPLGHSIEHAQNELRLNRSQIVIISFNLEVAKAAKRTLPGHEVCWIADSGREAPYPALHAIVAEARAGGLDGVDVEAGWPLDASLVQQIRSDGFRLYVWTVDDGPMARRLALARVDGVTTNRPRWLRAQISAGEGMSS